MAAAVVGGTASVIGGGKFSNGAVTGAFLRMYNDDNAMRAAGLDPNGDQPPDATYSFGANATIMTGPVGIIYELGMLKSEYGSFCIYRSECTIVGMGSGASLGIAGAVQGGKVVDGIVESESIVLLGGSGLAGNLAINYDKTTMKPTGAGKGVLGLGVIEGVGRASCKTTTSLCK